MSTDTNTGGPAFPITEWHLSGKTHSDWRGMTLRDYFAAEAMHALIDSSAGHYGVVGVNEYEHRCAAEAYKVADAMLKARES